MEGPRYGINTRFIELAGDAPQSYDAVLIATNHDAFDYGAIRTQARLEVDSRSVYQQPYANVIKA